jgi:hypothetical protein
LNESLKYRITDFSFLAVDSKGDHLKSLEASTDLNPCFAEIKPKGSGCRHSVIANAISENPPFRSGNGLGLQPTVTQILPGI